MQLTSPHSLITAVVGWFWHALHCTAIMENGMTWRLSQHAAGPEPLSLLVIRRDCLCTRCNALLLRVIRVEESCEILYQKQVSDTNLAPWIKTYKFLKGEFFWTTSPLPSILNRSLSINQTYGKFSGFFFGLFLFLVSQSNIAWKVRLTDIYRLYLFHNQYWGCYWFLSLAIEYLWTRLESRHA